MRQSFAANGGMAGLLGGKARKRAGGRDGPGPVPATQQDGQGRSRGEIDARTPRPQHGSPSMLGGAGQVAAEGCNRCAGTVGAKAAAIGSDVLGSAGVGHQAPYFGQTRRRRRLDTAQAPAIAWRVGAR